MILSHIRRRLTLIRDCSSQKGNHANYQKLSIYLFHLSSSLHHYLVLLIASRILWTYVALDWDIGGLRGQGLNRWYRLYGGSRDWFQRPTGASITAAVIIMGITCASIFIF